MTNISLTALRRDYLPELRRVQAAREKTLAAKKEESMSRLMKDLAVDKSRNPSAFADRFASDEEDEDDDGDMSDNDIIDRSAFLLIFVAMKTKFDFCSIDEERGPGQGDYIDLTQMRRGDENIRWPRPQ